LTSCYQLALPKNREATYPLVESAFGRFTLGPSYQLLGLAGGGVYPAGAVTGSAVRSYRTISPLPPAPTLTIRAHDGLSAPLLNESHINHCGPIVKVSAGSAVYFLWHFPWSTEGEPVVVSHHRCPVLLGLSSPAAPLLAFARKQEGQNGGGDCPTHSFKSLQIS